MGCPPVRKIIHSLKLVDYLNVQADNPWYNYYLYGNDHPVIWSLGHNKGLLFYERQAIPPFQSVHFKSAHPEISQMLAGFAAMA